MRELSFNELNLIKPGEAITLAVVVAIMAIGLLAVVIYRVFMSDETTIKLPGGYQFSWN